MGAPIRDRDGRQAQIMAWATQAFGLGQSTSLTQRGLRLLEEAIEAFQSVDGTPDMAHKLVDFVFGRPPGALHQELGGVGVCMLVLAAAAGLSADDEEQREIDRVLAKPIHEFTKRNAAKNAAGFLAVKPHEDDGKLGSGETKPYATQQGAATPGRRATAQGAAPAAGNVSEPQIDPTPDRVDHPSSSTSTLPKGPAMKTFVLEFDLSAATVVKELELGPSKAETEGGDARFNDPPDSEIRYRIVMSNSSIEVFWRQRDPVLGELQWVGGPQSLAVAPSISFATGHYTPSAVAIALRLLAERGTRLSTETPNGTRLFDLGKV